MKNPIPYPLRAARISLELVPFGFWWKPFYHRHKTMTEAAKQDGQTIWWARWAWFQISYGRML